MDLGLKDRVYVVTGATRGLGNAAARELDALSADPEATRAANESRIPLRRYGTPEEFGRAAAFLLSPAASYLTGVMLPVDGGMRHGF